MTEQQIIDAIRRGIREPQPRTVSDSLIQDWIADSVRALGLEIRAKDSRYFERQALVSSLTHTFSRPSDCQTILRVWDIGTSATAITGATTATPIVVTAVGHGRTTGDIVLITGVGGNTAANGTWKVTVLTDDTLSLDGSVGAGTYTAATGLLAKWPASGDTPHEKLDQISPNHSRLANDSRYFVRALQLVVDDVAFENDLLVEYTYSPTDVSDIPEEYHSGLVAYPVNNLIRVPSPEDPEYADIVQQLRYYQSEWKRVVQAVGGASVAQGMTHRPPAKGYMGAL